MNTREKSAGIWTVPIDLAFPALSDMKRTTTETQPLCQTWVVMETTTWMTNAMFCDQTSAGNRSKVDNRSNVKRAHYFSKKKRISVMAGCLRETSDTKCSRTTMNTREKSAGIWTVPIDLAFPALSDMKRTTTETQSLSRTWVVMERRKFFCDLELFFFFAFSRPWRTSLNS
jgi:hypothetical protein